MGIMMIEAPRGPDPRIHDELQRGKTLRQIVIDEAHHRLPGQARQ
jgi:hypothetical protein